MATPNIYESVRPVTQDSPALRSEPGTPETPEPPSKDGLTILELVQWSARYRNLFADPNISEDLADQYWEIGSSFAQAAMDREAVTVEDLRAQMALLASDPESCLSGTQCDAWVKRFSPGDNWQRLADVVKGVVAHVQPQAGAGS